MPPSFARGEIVLARFPFSDLTGSGIRPCLILSPGLIGQDLILAAISSVLRGSASPTDCLVDNRHPEFAQTGLRVSSVIRLHKLATVEQTIVARRLGILGPGLQAEVDRLLKQVVGL